MNTIELGDYTNQGFGLVLSQKGAGPRLLLDMFQRQNVWTSAALNDRLGWQFSQYVYALRKRHVIKTERIGYRKFQYVYFGPKEKL